MKKTLLTVALLPVMASAGWNEVELPNADYYQVYVGDKKTRVADSVLFWTKEAYVPDGVGENADIDYGSKISRYFADCISGSFSVVHESTYKGFGGKGKTIKVSNSPTVATIASEGSLNELVIAEACSRDDQVTVADISNVQWINAHGLCFPDKRRYDAFNSFSVPIQASVLAGSV